MDKSLKTILVTGGAGYVGSVLIKKLLSQNFNIKIIDSLVYGSDGISDHLGNNSLELINTDIRKIQDIPDIFHNVDCIIHLAAVVGEPLCKKIPLAAKQINEFATKNLIKLSKKSGIKRFIFASTCSNYGKMDGSSDFVIEESLRFCPRVRACYSG